jgi:hypothetical protein
MGDLRFCTGVDRLFDLWMEHEPIDIIATLRGYPDGYRGRRWYVFKRFQTLNEWTDIRLDLDLDDDLSPKTFDGSRCMCDELLPGGLFI